MSIKTPRLIRDRCGVFYFRLLVPKALRLSLGKLEWRRSLATKDAATARERALRLNCIVEGWMSKNKVSDFAHLFADDVRLSRAMTIDHDRGYYHADTPEETAALTSVLNSYHNVQLARENREAAAAMQAFALASKTPKTSECGVRLSAAIEQYLQERSGTLKPASFRKHRGALKTLVTAFGDVDVASIGKKGLLAYKLTALNSDNLAPSTVNDLLSVARGFFDFCIQNGVAPDMENPVEGSFIKGARNQKESYQPFTVHELERIFNPDTYARQMKMPDFYWGPLLALFTGARAEEIASLTPDQVLTENGVHYLHILDGKTVNAVRKVPLHQALLDLGFMDYALLVRQRKHVLLFPHLVHGGLNGYRKNMCRKFGTYLDRKDVGVSNPLKVFHSLRHTVISKLTDAGVNDGQKKCMVGHDIDSKPSAHDDYIHEDLLSITNLAKAINKLSYPSLNMSALKLQPELLLEASEARIQLNAKRPARPRKVVVK